MSKRERTHYPLGIPVNKIKVLVVDDSSVARMALTRMLASSDRVEVVGVASNGNEAIRMARELVPDIITLDVEMSGMDGLTALRHLAGGPWKIIMVSSYTTRGAEITIKALEAGAIDYLAKPSKTQEIDSLSCLLTAKIEAAAASAAPIRKRKKQSIVFPKSCSSILIGASTGGPRAITTLLSMINGPLPWPTVIAMHMLPGFTGPFSRHLSEKTGLPAMEVTKRVVVEPGVIYVAPGGKDMIVMATGNEIYLRPEEPKAIYNPSVDRLLETGADVWGAGALALILTGMGQDGLVGVRRIKEKGGTVWVQDEESSVVWGMPRAVVNEGLAQGVMNLGEMADAIEKMRAGS
ncbi:MAG: chemotaxis-specific protein-glutamate methyltransferase CheB [candidate division WOR-3 bacterium]